jgi:hypothetical protein
MRWGVLEGAFEVALGGGTFEDALGTRWKRAWARLGRVGDVFEGAFEGHIERVLEGALERR